MDRYRGIHTGFGPGEPTYIGHCPRCGRADGYLNVGSEHYGVCERDRVFWTIGAEIFASWESEHEELWQQSAERLELYQFVEPWFRDEQPWRRDVPVGLRLRNLVWQPGPGVQLLAERQRSAGP